MQPMTSEESTLDQSSLDFPLERKKELLFPHEEVRKSQAELLLDVEKTVKEGSQLLANAPTGLGKTSSALGPVLNYALKNNLKVWFLTNRHTQHTLAVDTLKQIQGKFGIKFSCVDLIGKKWMCNQEVKDLFSQEFTEFCKSITQKNECEFMNKVKQNNKLTVETRGFLERLEKRGVLHNQEIIDLCQEEGFCSYEISLELAKKARVMVGDYYYVFNPFIQDKIFGKVNHELEKTILVIDEAHNLPGRVVEMLSNILTSNMLKNGVSEARKFGYFDVADYLEKMNGVLQLLNNAQRQSSLSDGFSSGTTYQNNSKKDTERLVTKDDFLNKVKEIADYENLMNELEIAADDIRKQKKRSYIGGVVSFLEAWTGEDEGFTRIISEKDGKYGRFVSLSYHCLDPSLVTKKIFDQVHSAVLMSGTLNPTFMYNDILGMECLEKEYPNPFPMENKLTLIVPETTTKYNLRGEAMYQKIADKCSEMLDLIPGNCAIFFPSYYLRDQIGFKIKEGKKKFWEKGEMSKDEKEEFLDGFKQEKCRGGVLLGVMGGSFGEGVDLPGDLLQGVIIVGVPLGTPDLKTKEVIKYFDNKFAKGWDYGYLFPAMNKCFQSSGRCIRSSTDKGAVIYLDERFSWQNYFRCFPKEGLIVTKDYNKFLGKFFKRPIPFSFGNT